LVKLTSLRGHVSRGRLSIVYLHALLALGNAAETVNQGLPVFGEPEADRLRFDGCCIRGSLAQQSRANIRDALFGIREALLAANLNEADLKLLSDATCVEIISLDQENWYEVEARIDLAHREVGALVRVEPLDCVVDVVALAEELPDLLVDEFEVGSLIHVLVDVSVDDFGFEPAHFTGALQELLVVLQQLAIVDFAGVQSRDVVVCYIARRLVEPDVLIKDILFVFAHPFGADDESGGACVGEPARIVGALQPGELFALVDQGLHFF